MIVPNDQNKNNYLKRLIIKTLKINKKCKNINIMFVPKFN